VNVAGFCTLDRTTISLTLIVARGAPTQEPRNAVGALFSGPGVFLGPLRVCWYCSGAVANGPGRSMRALSRLADVAGFWTLDRTTITGRSAVILRQHTTPFRPMIVPFDDLELVYQSLRTLEPPHTHKFPRVNAQDSKLGPIQPWDVKDFLRPGRVSAKASTAPRPCKPDLLRTPLQTQASSI
jgi:hypothetical protein